MIWTCAKMFALSVMVLVLDDLTGAEGTDRNSAYASEVLPLPPELQTSSTPAEKQKFQAVIEHVLSNFQPIANSHSASFSYEINWDSSGIGAFTLRRNSGRDWHIIFYDGILRLPFVTDDLIALLVCHEVGHHLGGYPFKDNGWASAEGQADHFATHACATKLWSSEPEINQAFRDRVRPAFRTLCDETFGQSERRNLCYRVGFAMEAVRQYEGFGGARLPEFETPDPSTVNETLVQHPRPQCRLDTQVAGMLCPVSFDFSEIPGLSKDGRNTLESERDSNRFVCHRNSKDPLALKGVRPRCWFASLEEGSLD